MHISTGLLVPGPLLQIVAGGQSFSVVDPGIDVYIGNHPPELLGNMAVVRFSGPFSIGVRLQKTRGLWSLSADRGQGHAVLVSGSCPDARIVVPPWEEGCQSPVSLVPGWSRLIFFGAEEVLLWVPGLETTLMSAGQVFDVRASKQGQRNVSETWIVPSLSKAPASPEEEQLANELTKVTQEFADLSTALQSAPPGEIWNLLSKAAQMAKRRRGALEANIASLKGHVANVQDAVEEALNIVQKKPPLLTADQYAWALAYARTR